MTARRKTKAGATKRKSRTTASSALVRLEDELPANLREYVKQVHERLNVLERNLERAIPKARRRMAGLIREASHNLGMLEERGAEAWRNQADQMTRDAQKMLRKLEKGVAPPPRKRAARKKASPR